MRIPKMKMNEVMALVASALISLTLASAQAASPVVAVPGVSLAEIKAYATSRDRLPLSEYLEAARPGSDRERELKTRFQRAQKFWLSGDTDEARAEFRGLTELSLKADWKTPQREVLQAAHLRLAQTSASGTEKNSWLESAVRYFGDLPPDLSLFPPPLIEDFNETKHRLLDGAVEFEAWEVFPDSRFVIVDGRKISTTDRRAIPLAAGLHRVTALSDTHVAITEFLTVNQLRLFRASPAALIEGSCATAKLKVDLPEVGFPELYSGQKCPASVASLQLKPQFLTGVGQSDLTQLAGEVPKASVTKKTWLWIAGGLLVSGAGYALARELSKEKPPETVHRSGF
ncbi:MAG: hypothetical protein EOP06_27380 [Proteobacteria bacterium]|nr:MAG: hypothetical protein EOP06_27380 [Pseudomonadota bacterium]